MPFEVDPQYVADIEAALAAVTVDPTQVGISALHFRDLAGDFINDRNQKLLIADIEDHFDAVDPVSYLREVLAAEEPESAAAAYEQLITGEWDGELS